MNDVNEIQRRIKLVTKDMEKRHPNCRYTVRILLWDDGTSLVECRHARQIEEGIIICNSVYYKNKLKYHEHQLDGDRIRIDGRGYEHNVKEPLR